MKKTFLKNLLRDIKKSLSRYLSIVVIIAVGVAFYVGVRNTSPAMKLSADTYFNTNGFMDFKVISTLGLTGDDLSQIRKIDRVTKAEGYYSTDAVVEKDKRQLVLNIDSQPAENGINSIRIIKGKRAEKYDEAVVEDKFLEENKLKLGDSIVLKTGNDSKMEDILKNTVFKIVGTAESPLYISEQRQTSSVGNGNVKGFIYVLPEVFKSDVYTEIYIRADSTQSKNSLLYNEDYTGYTASIEKALKDIGTSGSEIRYAEVLKTGNEKLNDAKAELEHSKKEAEKKFADGYKKLDEARNKLLNGQRELEKNETAFSQKMKEGTEKIEDGKSRIKSARIEINDRKRELENGKLQLAASRKQLNDSEAALIDGKRQAAENISSAVSQELAKAQALAEANPSNQAYVEQYNFLDQLYRKSILGKGFDDMYSSLKNNNQLGNIKAYVDIEALKNKFDRSSVEISSGRQELEETGKKLTEGEAGLDKGIARLAANTEKIQASEDELEKGRQEGLSKLGSARKELEDGQNELDKNTGNLKLEEEKANEKFRDAEAEIQKNSDTLNNIKKPDWYVLGRSENVGYETYRQDSDRINSIGKVFPLIFFLVASLVSLTTMTRMVQEKRTEIGTFKALGYTRTAIVAHYIIYSLSASIIGSIIGIFTGFRLFPSIIINAYSARYTIADMVIPFGTGLALQAAIIAVLFTVTAAVAATIDELREVPASLMRPKPPKSGKKILLERVGFIWKRFSFTKKVTARNIFRYKQRLFMTVIGIAACTGLMITGFGLKEGIVGSTKVQFNDIYRYDMQGTLDKNAGEADKDAIKAFAAKDSNVKSMLFTFTKNSSVNAGGNKSQDAYLVVPENTDGLNSYINLNMKGKELELDNSGVIITEKLSKLMNKKAGDKFEITMDDKSFEVRISAVTEHYVQHYIYMGPEYYKKIIGDKVAFNGFYGLLEDTTDRAKDNTFNLLKSSGDINSVDFKNNTYLNFNKIIASVNSVIPVLIISAGVLAFVVIYNLTNINITERKRELATIKLLGFYNHELAFYIYRENIILTLIGSLAGIPMGMLLHRLVITTAETNDIMFWRGIGSIYFLISILLTLLFSVIVNLAMYKRFDNIDMIESLKSAE
jgi:putative ABC transport system permease protein